MDSTTGNFSSLKKTTPTRETVWSRGTQSTVKKCSYVPKKLTIAPLNFDALKKEIEEASEKYDDDLFYTKSGTSSLNEKCDTEAKPNNIQEETDFEVIEKENLLPNKPQKKTEDSFDLDFSALSISATDRPAKEFATSKNYNKLAICKEGEALNINKCINPKVSTVPRKGQKTFESDNVSLEGSLNKLLKDKIPEMVCSVPLNIPISDHFKKLIVNGVEYLVLTILGKGGSSEVFQCFCVKNKHLVAIKCVSLESASASSYINEVKLLKKLQQCDRIIKMYDYEVLESDKKLLMVLEKCGEDMSKILKSLATQHNHMPVYMIIFYWMEMLYAVKQMHSYGVIHSDLKPANFLQSNSGLKLIDFGIASSVQFDMTSVIKTTTEGSCNYISPEALNSDTSSSHCNPGFDSPKYKVHYKSDVWSLGCILYQLVYRKTPFQHLNHLWSKLAYIMNPDHIVEYPEIDWAPPKIISAIKRCLQYDVKSRPSVDELISEFELVFSNVT